MIKEIKTLLEELPKKPTFSNKEIISKLQSLNNAIEESMGSDGSLVSIKGGKVNKVDEIKRYDIVYISVLGGIPHYLMVDKVIDEKVYCVCFSSTKKDYLILHEVENDRILSGSYVTNIYFCLSLDECKKSFIRVYEDKREALKIFNKIKSYYKTVFK